jgi:hypothetical protein
MKRLIPFSIVTVTAVMLSQCTKYEDVENTYPQSTTSNGALTSLLAQNAPPIQQFTFNAASGGYFICTGGATISINPNSFLYPNNTAVTGSVDLKVQEVYNKKDMICSGAFTTSAGRPLISGGEINVTSWQGNTKLKLANNNSVSISLPAGSTQPAPMFEFRAPRFNANSDFIPVNVTQPMATSTDSTGAWVYQFALDSLDWTNCDQYMMMTNQTEFSVPLPSVFNNTNTMVFVTSPLSLFASRVWNWDAQLNTYVCGYYRLPIGETFTFTAVSEINGNFYYDSREVEITEDIMVSMYPQPISQAQLMQNIGNL